MAKVISTRGISYHIERLIKEARLSILLVTPYLKIAKPLYDRLVLADARGVEISIVYGKTKLQKQQEEKLKKLSNCRIVYVENLHAKVYLSDRCGIIGSMNLYDYSEINNNELGIYFTRKDDFDLWHETINEVDLIIESGEITKETQSMEDFLIEQKKISSILNGDDAFQLKDYPIPNIEITTQYGFVTYNIRATSKELEKIQEKNYTKFLSKLGNDYRVYWENPFSKICIYDKRDITFKSEKTKLQYRKKAIELANDIVRNLTN